VKAFLIPPATVLGVSAVLLPPATSAPAAQTLHAAEREVDLTAGGEMKQQDCRIRKVIQVLKEDPSISLPELAHSCQISNSRLSHLFKREIGTNVKNYRVDHRLQGAAALLLSTGTPIKEIAYSAGYHHSSSFVRAFKARFGSSPACYRREHARKAVVTAGANK